MKIQRLIKFTIIISILIIFTLGLLVGLIFSKSGRCSMDPLSYGIEKMEKVNKVNFSCMCYSIGETQYEPFYFDDEGIYNKDPYMTGKINTLPGTQFP